MPFLQTKNPGTRKSLSNKHQPRVVAKLAMQAKKEIMSMMEKCLELKMSLMLE